MELNISGAPFPIAKNVTPATLSERFSDFEIDTRRGQRLLRSKPEVSARLRRKKKRRTHKSSAVILIARKRIASTVPNSSSVRSLDCIVQNAISA